MEITIDKDFEFHTQTIIKKDGWELTASQSKILELLVKNPSGVSRGDMTKKFYGDNYPMDNHSIGKIRAHLCYVRKFLLNTDSPYSIETITKHRITVGWKLNDLRKLN